MAAYLSVYRHRKDKDDLAQLNQDLFELHREQAVLANVRQNAPTNSTSWNELPKLFFNEVTRVPETDFTHPKTVDQLSIQMQKQFSASIASDDKIGATRDFAGTLLGLGSTVANEAGGVGKGVGFAYSRASEWLFMQAFTDKLVAALFPAEFVSIEAVGGPYNLYTETSPSQGKIVAINVVTKSKGGVSVAQMLADLTNQFFPG